MLDICPYCNGNRINKNGNKYNKQRYLCRDCHKSFCEEDARIKRPTFQRELALTLYINGSSFRSIQRVIELCFNTTVSHTLIQKWIKTSVKLLKSDCNDKDNNKKKTTIKILELDELYSYYYNFKKNKKNISKYGLLLTETDMKLIHLL